MIFAKYNNQACFKLIFSSSTGLDTEKKKEIHTQTIEYQPQLFKAEVLTKKTDKVTEQLHVKKRMLKAWKRQHAAKDNS